MTALILIWSAVATILIAVFAVSVWIRQELALVLRWNEVFWVAFFWPIWAIVTAAIYGYCCWTNRDFWEEVEDGNDR